VVRHIEVVFRHLVNLEGLYEESESEGVFVSDMRETAQLDGLMNGEKTLRGQRATRS